MNKEARELVLIDREVCVFLQTLFPEKLPWCIIGEPPQLSSLTIIGDKDGYQEFDYERYSEELQGWLFKLWVTGFIGRVFFEKHEIVRRIDNKYVLAKRGDAILDERSSKFIDCFSMLLQGGRRAYSEFISESLLWT